MRPAYTIGIAVAVTLMAALWLGAAVLGQHKTADYEAAAPLVGSGIPRYEIVDAVGMFAPISHTEALRHRWLLLDDQTGRIWLWRVNPATAEHGQQEGWRLCHVEGITDQVPFEP